MNILDKILKENLFIVIGGHKCGTTSLHQYLGQHPEIIMPQFKGEDILKKPTIDIKKYHQQYINIANKTVAGEVSSAYLYSQKACKNIKNYFPEAKIIAVLRNPFDRAFSHFNDMPKTHPLAQQNCNFEELCRNPANFLDRNVIFLGLYYSYIKVFLEEFKREQICILLFDDFVNNKQKYYRSLFDFVGVDSSFMPNTSIILRKGGKTNIKNNRIKKFFNDKSLLRSVVGSTIKPFTTPEQRRLIFLKTKNMFIKRKSSSSLAYELKQNLVDFYREDILKTQDLLNIDLSHWFKI